MLLLSRRVNEEVIIHTEDGLRIIITLTKMGGRQACLGFEAPLNVHIDRREVYEQKQGTKST